MSAPQTHRHLARSRCIRSHWRASGKGMHERRFRALNGIQSSPHRTLFASDRPDFRKPCHPGTGRTPPPRPGATTQEIVLGFTAGIRPMSPERIGPSVGRLADPATPGPCAKLLSERMRSSNQKNGSNVPRDLNPLQPDDRQRRRAKFSIGSGPQTIGNVVRALSCQEGKGEILSTRRDSATTREWRCDFPRCHRSKLTSRKCQRSASG